MVGRTGVTTEKTRIVSGRQHQIARVDREGGVDPETLAELERRFALALDRVGMVVLSDYGKGVLEPIARLIALARARAVRVLVDPKTAEPSATAAPTCQAERRRVPAPVRCLLGRGICRPTRWRRSGRMESTTSCSRTVRPA